MHIQSSSIAMQSSHLRASVHQQQASLTLWKEAPSNPAASESDKAANPKLLAQPGFSLNPNVNANNNASPNLKPNNSVNNTQTEAVEEEAKLSPELLKMKQAIESLMAWMSGRTVKIELFSEADMQPKTATTLAASPSSPAPTNSQNTAPSAPDWGMIYEEQQRYAEMESLSVGIQGAVTTADGRAINFDLSLALSRSYYSESNLSIRAGAALKDPLVINFGGQPAQLSLNKIEFDLVSQEAGMESIRQLNEGSGYLALDRNGNGTIDDGSELFGPNSGNGFADLALLDEDGNGWIDEADSTFAQLQIWQPNADGSQSLTGLAKLGIGALYTQGIEAPFDYKSADNQLQGQLRQAGVFLFEEGKAGSLQQIDLAV